MISSGFGGLGLACWPLVPKFAGSNPAEAVGFLRAKKILSTPTVPTYAAGISHVVADEEAPGGEKWEHLKKRGKSNGKLPLKNLSRMQRTRDIPVA